MLKTLQEQECNLWLTKLHLQVVEVLMVVLL